MVLSNLAAIFWRNDPNGNGGGWVGRQKKEMRKVSFPLWCVCVCACVCDVARKHVQRVKTWFADKESVYTNRKRLGERGRSDVRGSH